MFTVERKTISCYVDDMEPTIAITYNVDKESVATDIQFWIRNDKLYDYSILRQVIEIINNLKFNEKELLVEKDIFIAYQNTFTIENGLLRNYMVESNAFKTKKMAHMKVPILNFTMLSKEQIFKNIEKNIKKGEIL